MTGPEEVGGQDEQMRANAYPNISKKPFFDHQSKVINVGSDTFGNPIFHEGLQN